MKQITTQQITMELYAAEKMKGNGYISTVRFVLLLLMCFTMAVKGAFASGGAQGTINTSIYWFDGTTNTQYNTTPSTFYACADYYALQVTVTDINPQYGYNITVQVPGGMSAATARATSTESANVIPAWLPGSNSTLTWNIPPNYSPDLNYTLTVYFYLDCAETPRLNSNGNVITTNSSFPFEFNNNQTITVDRNDIIWPAITVTPMNITQNANYGDHVAVSYTICQTSGYVSDLSITETNPVVPFTQNGGGDQVSLTGPSGIITPLSPSGSGVIEITPAMLNTLCGQTSMATGQCIVVEDLNRVIAPSQCANIMVGFETSIVCNSTDLSSVATLHDVHTDCPGIDNTNNIKVGDENNSITMTGTVNQNSAAISASGLSICNNSFSLVYTFTNSAVGAGFPSDANEKVLYKFTCDFDPNLIDAPGTFIGDLCGTPVTVNVVGNQLVIMFPQTPGLLDIINSSSIQTICKLTLPGLSLHLPPINSGSCTLTNPTGLGPASLQYYTKCDIGNVSPAYHTINDADRYVNNFSSFSYQQVGIGNNSADLIGSGSVPFCWDINAPANTSPWTYTLQPGNTVKDLISCPNTTYTIQVIVPTTVSTHTTTPVLNISGSSNTIGLTLDAAHSTAAQNVYVSLPLATLPSECVSITVYTEPCGNGFYGGPVTLTINLEATCEDNTCAATPYTYCFQSITNTVSVHCTGPCASGINTDSMELTTTGTANSAYACDVVSDNVSGSLYTQADNVFLAIDYLEANGPDPIFNPADYTNVTVTYVDQLNQSQTITSNPANILVSGPYQSNTLAGNWEYRVTLLGPATQLLNNVVAAQTFVNFNISLQLNVECTLDYSGQGIYDLSPFNSILDFNYNSDTLYSCDGSAVSLLVFDHTDTTVAYFEPYVDATNPCKFKFLITDSASGALLNNQEMPVARPLITWPTDGSIMLTYDPALTVEGINYYNSEGQVFTYTSGAPSTCGDNSIEYTGTGLPLSYGPLVTGAPSHIAYTACSATNDATQLKIFGFKQSCGSYAWPPVNADMPLYYERLEIVFNKLTCANKEVFKVDLPHQLQDGKPGQICTNNGCTGFAEQLTPIKCIPTVTPGLTAGTINGNPVAPLTINPYSYTETFNPNTGINTSYIWAEASNTTYDNVSVTSSNFIPTSFTESPTSLTPSWFQLAGYGAFDVSVTFTPGPNCAADHVPMNLYYTCPSDTTTFNASSPPHASEACGGVADNINLPLNSPALTLTESILYPATPPGYMSQVFGNCYGVCCTDQKTWTVIIKNTGTGPAFNPILNLTQTGQAQLEIVNLQVQYCPGGVNCSAWPNPIPVYAPNYTINFENLPGFLTTGQTITGSTGAVLNVGDEIVVTITVDGSNNTCGWSALLQANVNCGNECGDMEYATPGALQTDAREYYFDLSNGCVPETCNNAGQCPQGPTPATCNPCSTAEPLTVTPNVVNPCPPNLGSITLHVSGGPSGFDEQTQNQTIPNYTYSWTPAEGNSNSATGLAAGPYSVLVSDGNCSTITNITLNNSGIGVSFTNTNPTCNGASNGSISASVTPAGCTLSWTHNGLAIGGNSPNLSNIEAGNYELTIVNPGPGCAGTTTVPVSISQPLPIVLTTTAFPSSCTTTIHNGSAQVGASGGSPGSPAYTYKWNNNATTDIIQNLAAGTYTVTVKDGNGCQATASATVTAGAVATIQGVYTCPQGGTLTANPAVSYVWSSTANDLGAQTGNPAVTVAPTTTTIYTVVITEADGCTASASVTLNGPMQVSQTDVNTCYNANNGSINITATGGLTPYSYEWATDAVNNNNWGNTPPTTANITGLAPGTYTVTVTSAANCSSTLSYTVTQPPVLTVTTQAVTSTCGTNNGSASATAGGGVGTYVYVWSNGYIGTNPTNLDGGTYTVTVYDHGSSVTGCSVIGTADVGTSSPVTLNENVVNQVCSVPGSATVLAGGDPGGTTTYTYNWSNGQAGTSATFLTATGSPYYVTVTSSNPNITVNDGCVSVFPVTINNVSDLSVSLNDINTCNSPGGGYIKGVVTGPGAYSFSWSNSSNPQWSSNSPWIQNLLTSGTYTVTVTDVNCCTATASVTVVYPDPFSVTTTTTNATGACGSSNGAVGLTVSGGTPVSPYQWSNTQNTTVISPTLSNVPAGVYYVLATDANGCTATAVGAVSDANASSDFTVTTNGNLTSCTGAHFDVTVTGIANPTLTWYDYWNQTALTSSSAPAHTSANNLSALNLQQDALYGVVVQDPASGCETAIPFHITPNPNYIQIGLTNQTCLGVNDGALNVSTTDPTQGYTYLWSTQSTASQITNLSPGSNAYSVTVTSAAGCTASDVITVFGPLWGGLSVSLTKTDPSSCSVHDGTITATPAGGTPCYKYAWSGSSATTLYVTGLGPGTYTLTITDMQGCSATASVELSSPDGLSASVTSVTTAGCGHDGAATITISGGTPIYTVSAPFGAVNGNTSTASPLTPGRFPVTVTDANLCTYTTFYTINDNHVMFVTPFPVVQAGCGPASVGNTTGSIGLSVVTLNPEPYVYAWSNNQTGATAVNLPPGTYQVTVTYGTCSVTASSTISSGASDNLSVTLAINTPCHGFYLPQIKSTVTGGTAPYAYKWSTGSTSPHLQLAHGLGSNVTLTVTDANCCEFVVTKFIPNNLELALQDPPPAAIQPTCGQNNGTVSAAGVGGTGNYTYSWTEYTPTNLNGTPGPGNVSSISNLGAGVYVVTVTDGNCSASAAYALNPTTQSWPAIALTPHLSCGTGLPNASIDYVSPVSPASAYDYYYTIANYNQNHPTRNPSGLYGDVAQVIWAIAVPATGSSACGAAARVMYIPSPLTFTPPSDNSPGTLTNVSCYGGTNGEAIALASSTNGPVTYTWSQSPPAPLHGEDARDLPAENYCVTASDLYGCQASVCFTIYGPSQALSVSLRVTSPTACGLNNGTITTTITGGTPCYNYIWSNGAITKDLGSLSAGTYVVTVTDGNGCTASASVDIPAYDGLNATVTTTATTCGTSIGTATVNISGGTAPYTIVSVNPTPQFPSLVNNSTSLSGLPAGNYSATISDSHNCQFLATFTIDNGVINLTTSSTPAGCSYAVPPVGGGNGTATAIVSGGGEGYTYTWNDGQSGATAINLSSGFYQVTVSYGGTCSATSSVFVQSQQGSVGVAIAPLYAGPCGTVAGNTLGAQVSGGAGPYSYTWAGINLTPAQVNNQIIAGGTSATNYSITVTDANCCSATFTYNYVPVQPLAITLTTTDANCPQNDGTARITLSGGTPGGTGYLYSWSEYKAGSAGWQPLIYSVSAASGISPGIIEVTVTELGVNNCSATKAAAISQVAASAPSWTVPTPASPGLGCTANGPFENIAVTLTGNPLGYTYSNTNNNQTMVGPGIYGVFARVATNGCMLADLINIPNPMQNFNQGMVSMGEIDVTCPGGTNGVLVALSKSTNPGLMTYQWGAPINTNQVSGTLYPIFKTNLGVGNYTITATDAFGCSASGSVTINGPSPIVITAAVTSPTTCSSANGTIALTVNGGSPCYSYLWSYNNQTSKDLSNLLAGTYTVTVTDSHGCTASATVSVPAANGLTINVSNITTPKCFGYQNGSATVYASSGSPVYTYNWSNTSGPTISGVGAGTYPVTVTDSHGCSASTDVTISQPNLLTVSVTPTNIPCNSAAQVFGSGTAVPSGGTVPYIYYWSNTTTNNGITNNQLAAGTYSVTVKDANLCTATASFTITANSLAVTATSTYACVGMTNGTVTIAVAPPPVNSNQYTYSIYSEPSNSLAYSGIQPTATGLAANANAYNVTVTEPNGCTGTTTVVVQTDPLAVTVNGQTNGSCVGTAHANTTPLGIYSYHWNTGAVGASLSPLTNNTTYTVVVSDNICSVTSQGYTYVNNDLITIGTTVHDRCTNFFGTATANLLSGPTGTGLTYNWHSIPSNQFVSSAQSVGTILIPRSYAVTVTNSYGCSASATATIGAGTIPTVSVTPSSAVVCPNSSIHTVQLTASGTPTGLTYAWNNSITSTSAQITTNNINSNTTYTVTVTDGDGCTAAASSNLYVPSVTLGSLANVCWNNGTHSLDRYPPVNLQNVNGATPTYSWSTLNPTTIVPPVGLSWPVTVTVSLPGVTNCVTATANENIYPDPQLNVTASPNPVCPPGSPVTLNVTSLNEPIHSINWAIPSIPAWERALPTVGLIPPFGITTYVVSAVGPGPANCPARGSVTVNALCRHIGPPWTGWPWGTIGPVLQNPTRQWLCSNTAANITFSNVTANGQPGDYIEWARKADFSDMQMVAVPATFFVTVPPDSSDTLFIRRLSGTGDTLSDSSYTIASVVSNHTPPLAPAPQVKYANARTMFTFDNVGAINSCPDDFIAWSTRSDFASMDMARAPVSPSIMVDTNSTDTIWFRRQDSLGTYFISDIVYTTATVYSTQSPPVGSGLVPQAVCADTPVIFDFGPVMGNNADPDSLQWSLTRDFSNYTSTIDPGDYMITVTPGTIDTIWVRSIDSAGVVSNDTFTTASVTSQPAEPVAPAAQTACADTPVVFNFDSVTATGCGANWIVWSLSSNFSNPQYEISPANIAVTVNPGTTDTIWMESMSLESGAISTPVYTTATVTAVPLPPVPPAPQTVCSAITTWVTLDSVTSAGCGADLIEWSLYSNFPDSQFMYSPGSISVPVPPGVTDTIWIRSASSGSGAVSSVVFTTITNNSEAGFSAFASKLVYNCQFGPGDDVLLNVNGGHAPYTFNWSNGSTVQNPAGLTTGTYYVTITDASGCIDTASANVRCNTGCSIDSLGVLCSKCYTPWSDTIVHHPFSVQFYYDNSENATSVTATDMLGYLHTGYCPAIIPGWNNILLSVNAPPSVQGVMDTITLTVFDSLTGNSCTQQATVEIVCDGSTAYGTCSGNIVLLNQGVTFLGTNPVNGHKTYALVIAALNNSFADIVGGVYSISSGFKASSNPVHGPVLAPGITIDTIYVEAIDTTADSACILFGVTDSIFCPLCSTSLCVAIPGAVTSCSITGLTLSCGTCIPYGNIGSEHFWSMSFNYSGSNGSRMQWRTLSGNHFGSDNKTVYNGGNVNLVVSINPFTDTLETDTVIITVIDSLTGDTCSQAVGFSLVCGADPRSPGGTTNILPSCGSTYTFNVTGVYPNVVDPNNGLLTYMGIFDFTNAGTDTIGIAPVQCATCLVNDADGGFVAPGVIHDTVYFTPLAPALTQVCYTFGLFNTSICGVCAQQVCFNIGSSPCGAGFTMNDTAFCSGDSICINVTGGTRCAVYVDSISLSTLRFAGATPYPYCGNLNGANSSGYHNIYVVVSTVTPTGITTCSDTIKTHYYLRPYCACGVTVDTCPELRANFGYTIYPGYVILKDKSVGNPTIVEWYVNGQNFVTGPGDTLKYVFAHSGQFEVCQTIHYLIYGSDQCCLKDTCMYIMGSVDTCSILNLTADFSYTPNASAPYTYNFQPIWPVNAVPSVITWNFGDSSSVYSDTAVQATHTFDTAGYYDVCVNEIWFLPGNYCCIDSQCYQVYVGAIRSLMKVNPNPFQHTVTVEFQINSPGKVELLVFDPLGRIVKTLINSTEYSSGYYKVDYDLSDLTDALYNYRFRSADGMFTGKLIKQ